MDASSAGCAFAPFCRAAMPETTSSLSTILPSSQMLALAELTQPDLRPLRHPPRSFTRSGVPFFVVTTVSSMS